MTPRTDIAERILALPLHERKLAVGYFRHLVEQQRAAMGPTPISCVEMARSMGLEPDPWQVDVLESQASRILLNCSRQSGKSTMSSLLAFHLACYQPDSLILLLSPSLRQSQELFKKVMHAHRVLGRPVAVEGESALRLELTNGSRIISLPGKEHSIRGFSGVRLIVVDEAARVPNDLYFSVRPMLAVSGGRLIALSTPFGTRGWWYDAWTSNETWERYEVPVSQCPRIPPEFLAEEREALGEWWYSQEYECRFQTGDSQPFSPEDIERAFDEEIVPWEL